MAEFTPQHTWRTDTDPKGMPMVESTSRPEPRNGLGITSFVLGIVSAILGTVPLFSLFALPAAIVGIVLGFIGRSRVKRGAADNPKLTWAGIILSCIGVVFSIIGMVMMQHAIDQLGQL